MVKMFSSFCNYIWLNKKNGLKWGMPAIHQTHLFIFLRLYITRHFPQFLLQLYAVIELLGSSQMQSEWKSMKSPLGMVLNSPQQLSVHAPSSSRD